MRSSRGLLRAGGLVLVSFAGGALALAGAAALGRLGSSTTIREAAAPEPVAGGGSSASFAGQAHALTSEQIYARDAPGVVQIAQKVVETRPSPFVTLPAGAIGERPLGSGFVIDKAGHIVTNEHVVGQARRVQVSFSGHDQIAAKVIGKDASTDVAVLQIDARARSLTPLPLGDSDGVQVGDPVVAIGNPSGFTRTATAGIVSSVERTIDSPDGVSIEHAIQTDAPIDRGSSGGPLIDAFGNVIGVDSRLSSATRDAQATGSAGFALPIDAVESAVAQLIRNGKVEHAYLGVAAAPVTRKLAALFDFPTTSGLMVEHVRPGSAADRAGLRGGTTSVLVEGESYDLGGDIIVGAGGAPVSTLAQLRDLIARMKPGERLPLRVFSGRRLHTIEVRLGAAPS